MNKFVPIVYRQKKNTTEIQTVLRQPNEEDFPVEVFTETIKWRKLTLGVWQIMKMKSVTIRFGLALVLTLANESEGAKDVWAPDRLQTKLQEKPETHWILHKGFATRTKNPDRQYFNFRLGSTDEKREALTKTINNVDEDMEEDDHHLHVLDDEVISIYRG